MSTSWHTRPLAAFDIETTGLDVATDRIITAALWRIDPGTGDKDVTAWLIDPGTDIPVEATDIHGITTEHVRRKGRPAAEAVPEIGSTLTDVADQGLPLVIYNAPYDLSLLHNELVRHGVDPAFIPRLRVVDPLVLDKQTDPYRRGGRKLTDVCAHHGVPLAQEQAHGATADALAAGRLAWKLCSAFADLAAMTVEELHTAQIGWKADQAASFQAYLRRTRDPEAVIDGTWPFTAA